MDELPGAREELESARQWLREHLLRIASIVVPGRVAIIKSDGGPRPVDTLEHPEVYRSRVQIAVEAYDEPWDPQAESRARDVFLAEGWEADEPAPIDDRRLSVRARRDGYETNVFTDRRHGTVLLDGRTPEVALYERGEQAAPPARTAETVSPDHVLCYECDGLGRCPVCRGAGWLLPERRRCPLCFGARTCPTCDGQGELSIWSMTAEQARYYPELLDRHPELWPDLPRPDEARMPAPLDAEHPPEEADGSEGLRLARTNAEAHAYLDTRPCPACGETRCDFRGDVVMADGDLAGRYTGTCPRCGTERVYRFRIPAQVLPPPADRVTFGGPEPSRLLDPGEWLAYADLWARRVPREGSAPSEEARRRHALRTAVAALEEVLKFIPEGADEVPLAAFTTREGRAVREREPGRFSRDRLEAVRDTYADILRRL